MHNLNHFIEVAVPVDSTEVQELWHVPNFTHHLSIVRIPHELMMVLTLLAESHTHPKHHFCSLSSQVFELIRRTSSQKFLVTLRSHTKEFKKVMGPRTELQKRVNAANNLLASTVLYIAPKHVEFA